MQSWELKAGQLTVFDLSFTCATAEAACSLFNICPCLFLEKKAAAGHITKDRVMHFSYEINT
ncbi:hypothetical protein FVEN_g13106 [Fusarium venenatum]|uniref:Uncharacterized protein n=1 Tax=Fusarium venenatum TaxID=56646 RepID=A0A2L2TND7_9HYPO|nr:uncharacterized protein FVRRES_03723 [Fusarium venenatum]KAG8350943.1 hypothetical protein FVEN_g13106 [Fusarium venenatum]CEI67211.1 unnamed protein product [Fusarium venenatum]